ncbi:MAG: DUF4167 domain-containing protein [Pseudomonadota bacterium]
MRGRGRKGPNPLTRTYESNGPDVKIRGTAMHIAEKYQQLARDAQASGDRVMFENYNQHAEHYLRIVAAAQPQQQPSVQPATRADGDETSGEAANGTNGATPPVNGSERPSQDSAAADGDVVDANSPQPFIEDMPVIDQEGQVNGAGQKADADEGGADDKPRRRTRTSRSRAPRRDTGDLAEGTTEATSEEGGSPVDAAEDEQAKPRRRTTRTRRPKTNEDVPAETATASD